MSSDTNIWETGVNNEGNGTDNNQYYISDSVNRLTIQRGSGNIGIGTNAPSQLLDVSGNINLTGNIYLSNTGTIYKNGQEYAGGSSGGTSSLWTENGTKIHYNAGNVGINTSDPSETLEVIGNIKATNIEAAGANITAINATNITSGTLDNARLPADIDVTSLKGTGANITALSATNITSGTLDNARLPANISITGDMTAKNLNVTGVTTTINTDTYQTENLEIISTGADGPSLKITHDTASHDILQVTDTTSTQSLTMTHDGKIGIGTDAPSAPLHIYDASNTNDIFKASDTEITINRSIIPEINDTVDIGSAERKIRDMYISNNSLWLGDDHKLAITSDGTMKFRKRNKSVLPKVLRDASGTDAAAIAHVNQKYGTSFANVSEFKLNHVLSYAKTINSGYKTSDIFGEDTEDYEQDTAADAWQINSSKIFLGSDYTNIGIGTNNPDPAFKLDVAGNVNTTGTISTDNITIKGSAESGSGSIKLNCEANSHGVSIKGPPHSANQSYTLTLPSTAPEASKVLSTDASGNLSWVDPGSSSASSIQNITTTASKVTIDTEMDVTNNVTVKGSGATGSGAIKLNCENNSHGVSIKGPPHSANQSYTLTLPSTAPEASKVLSTDASGNLSWVDQASGSGSGGGLSSNILIHKIIEPVNSQNLTSESITTSEEHKILVFEYDASNDNGNGETEYILNVNDSTLLDVLIVGGGGSGGSGSGTSTGGGGGGGGEVKLIESFNAAENTNYTIKVGKGGDGVLNKDKTTGAGNRGTNSSFYTYTALGGGGGGIRDTSATAASTSYTGGGEGGFNGGGNAGAIGYDGGNGNVGGGTNYGAGGGGGSGGIGGNSSGNNGGNGGVGIDRYNGTIFSELFGDNYGHKENGTIWFGGGGGGSGDADSGSTNGLGNHGGTTGNNTNSISANALWGGGSGGSVGTPDTDITGDGINDRTSGNGGSGIVIVRYKINKIFDDVTKLFQPQFYTMKEKPQITSGPVAQVTDSYATGSDLYKYMMFKYDATNDNGSGQTEYELNFTEDTTIDLLVVAGGGGGGAGATASSSVGGAGGGAGGLIYKDDLSIDSGNYTIKIGRGGGGSVISSTTGGENGKNSSIEKSDGTGVEGTQNFIAIGGGGGGKRTNDQTGKNGGSGGGAVGNASRGNELQTSSASGGFGNNGGSSTDSSPGGGGGAGAPGSNGVRDNSTQKGHGGDGKQYNITGTYVYYAGGGGAGKGGTTTNHKNDHGFGGQGGGGNGWDNVTYITAEDLKGTPHTGGGGGGGSQSSDNVNGGNGGSGVVIIRYLAKTLTQDIDTTLANKAGESIEWDTDNNKFTLSSNVTITSNLTVSSNLTVYNDINFMGNLYQNGEIFVSGSGSGGEVTSVTSNILVHKLIEPTTTPSITHEYVTGSSEYKIITFEYDSTNDNGNGQTEYIFNAPEELDCDILVIAGGGGGGATDAGGGGAGGLIYETGIKLDGEYTIKVGNGGAGGAGGVNVGNNPGLKGKNSQIQGGHIASNYDAVGGGGGGSGHPSDLEPNPAGGGSSGGLGSADTSREAANIHVDGQGHSGGTGGGTYGGGGGGGAGGPGGDANGYAGVGGIGKEIDITGTATYYAGGGGGGFGYVSSTWTNADGGLGGGGTGKGSGYGSDATFYGGGGGGGGSGWGAGGDGYKGLVIIRYKIKKVFDDVTKLFQPKFYTSISEPSVANYGEVTENLIAHYKFDSSGNLGANSASLTGSSLHGTTSGNATINTTKGVFNNSSYYPGNAQSGIKIDADSNKLYPYLNQSAITISFWCWSVGTGASDHGRLFYGHVNGSANNVNSFQCAHWGGGHNGQINTAQLTFIISNNDENQTNNIIYTTKMPAFNTAWSHVVLVLEPQSMNWTTKEHTAKIYVNGELDKTFTNIYMPTFGNGTTDTYDFNIGSWINLDSNYREYNGYIDDFRIYNKALSATEIEKLYTAAYVSNDLVTNSDIYKYYMFKYDAANDNGSGQTEYTLNFTENTEAEILVVAGGGAGGTYIGGGGGGGGVLHVKNTTINTGSYSIKVGKGGDGVVGNAAGAAAQQGKNSEAFGIEVFGGGYGGGGSWGSSTNGQDGSAGGSGGAGGSASNVAGSGGTKLLPDMSGALIPTTSYEYYGGNGADSMLFSSSNAGGAVGGNGGGGAGGDAPANTDQGNAGAGADGIPINITGTTYYWGGGGGGGQYDGTKAGDGGKGGGGGGNGSQQSEGIGIGGSGGITEGQDGDPEGDGTPTAGSGGAHTGGGGGGTGRTSGSPNPVSGSGGSGIVIVKYKTKTLSQDIDTTLATKAGENIEWDTDNKQFTLTSNVTITSNLEVYNDINFKGNLYQNGELFVSGSGEGGSGSVTSNILVHKLIEPTTTPNITHEYVTGTTEYKIITFEYDSTNDNGSGQTEYSINFDEEIECDILIVGGGGGGGGGNGESTNGDGTGGGGGGGGLVFIPNITMSNNYNIKVGKGGEGREDAGENGYNSLIEKQDGQGINGITNFLAIGGGGGGDGRTTTNISGPGVAGGSGGGGGGNSTSSGGESTQNTYNGKGFGNSGGNSLSSSGDQSGGGGGAGSVGQSSHAATSGGVEGGEGGMGLHKVTIDGIEYKFKDLFGISNGEYIVDGTTARDYGTAQDYINRYYHADSDTYQSTIPAIEEGVYFAGGGAGKNSATTGGYTYGGLGGGASVLINNSGGLKSGIEGTGGGGTGGGKQNNHPNSGVLSKGTNGGSGIVIIRYKIKKVFDDVTKLFEQQFYTMKEKPQITSGPVEQVTDSYVTGSDLYKYMMFTYDAANDNGSGQTEYALNFTEDTKTDILIVAGGGAGGVDNGAGGGGGGVLYAKDIQLNGSYNIKVGKGGLPTANLDASYNTTHYSENGYDSEFGKTDDILIVKGGGYGGNANDSTAAGTDYPGGDGGSGGGGSYSSNTGGSKVLPTYNSEITANNSQYYGSDGGSEPGTTHASPWYCMGGGGASGVIPTNANGSDGIQINIDGNNYYWGAGGGGSFYDNVSGNGGKGGGGGGGGDTNENGTGGLLGINRGSDGTAISGHAGLGGNAGQHTGSGGGGNSWKATSSGGAGGSGVVIIRYLAKILTQDIDTTLETKAGENIEWDTDNNKFTLTSNVTITSNLTVSSNLTVYNDINFMGNLYQNGEEFVSGNGDEPIKLTVENILNPTTSPSQLSYEISAESDYKTIYFKYDSGNVNASGQTEYTLEFNNSTECDILLVGGGGGGGSDNSGGGGAGGLVLLENIQLYNGITIKVGGGGAGAVSGQTNTGQLGKDSSIEFSETYVAKGGGGGGTGQSNATLHSGTSGGSGGGSAYEGFDGSPGTSTQDQYILNGLRRGWGFAGGDGKVTSGAGQGAGGGGGGASEVGINGIVPGNKLGGHGGDGKYEVNGSDFKTMFNITDTTIGDHIDGKVYFAGGGGGGNDNNTNSTNLSDGSGYNNRGGFGGGGDGGFNSTYHSNPGIANTGGGGGGTTFFGSNHKGGDGGSGIVILRYKYRKSLNIPSHYYIEKSGPQITSGPEDQVINSYVTGSELYKYMMFTYDAANDNGSNQTEYTLNFSQNTDVDILVVAGGGGGGKSGSGGAGGGGGAGGLIYLQNQTISSGSYTIKVGKGGNIQTTEFEDGYSGYNSSFNDNIAIGGGGGGGHNSGTNSGNGYNGGSGGGGGTESGGANGTGGAGTTNQGNNGGVGSSSNANSPGGGGSGNVGENGTSTSGGDGGTGTLINITGAYIAYAGGGGGGSEASNNPGSGMASGGNGGGTDSDGSNALDNTGSGGGGAGGKGIGGAGGSGVVIIRYLAKSLGQDIDKTLATKAGTGLEWDNATKKFNVASEYGPGTTESYLFLQTSAVFQNDDVDLYENRKTSLTLQSWGPDAQWQSFGGANKIAEQLQNCFTYFLAGNRRDGNIHIITLNNSQTNATADRKYYAMRISSTQMKVWGSYETSHPKAYNSALTWNFSSGATIYKTF